MRFLFDTTLSLGCLYYLTGCVLHAVRGVVFVQYSSTVFLCIGTSVVSMMPLKMRERELE